MEIFSALPALCAGNSPERYRAHYDVAVMLIFFLTSDDGLAPVRRQAIICNSDGYFTDAHMRHSASMS